MRKILPVLALAAAAAVTTPAMAQSGRDYYAPDYYAPNYVAPAAGVAVGTVVGVGLYEGWLGSSAAVAAAPATAVGAAAVGGVAGIGTVALLDAATQHCRGFGIFVTPREQCVNGVWVGDLPPPRHVRRHG
jgi:hypothetical protein